MKIFKIALLAVSLCLATLANAQQNKILVAAAADLKFALDSVVQLFQKANPNATVNVTYGSSGKLSEQILNDAPFDLFFSADIAYPKKLSEKGFTISPIVSYGIGRIVIWSKKIDPTTSGINALSNAAITKIAIANPVHAPYGRRAEEALKHYKIYEAVKDKLVFGENISQTAQFVTSGAADIGIVALSLARSPGMIREQGKYYLIPEASHQPLQQGFVILKHAQGNMTATAFRDFINTKQVQNIFSYFGFRHNE